MEVTKWKSVALLAEKPRKRRKVNCEACCLTSDEGLQMAEEQEEANCQKQAEKDAHTEKQQAEESANAQQCAT